MHPDICITEMETVSNAWVFHTAGNDTIEPFTRFRVCCTTNLPTPAHLWETNSYTVTPIDPYGSNIFTVPQIDPVPPNTFHRIDAIWP